jgi:hypothetical protein
MNILAAIGLAFGGALGLAGAMVAQQNIQAILWAIDAAGIVMASALLAVKYFRTGNDIVASGFLVFAIGEGVLLSGTAAGPAGSVPAFAAGTSLWATALLLISIPKFVRRTDSASRSCERDPVHHHGGENLLGRAVATHFGTSTKLRLPAARGDIHWLDLDAMARARMSYARAVTSGFGPEHHCRHEPVEAGVRKRRSGP